MQAEPTYFLVYNLPYHLDFWVVSSCWRTAYEDLQRRQVRLQLGSRQPGRHGVRSVALTRLAPTTAKMGSAPGLEYG